MRPLWRTVIELRNVKYLCLFIQRGICPIASSAITYFFSLKESMTVILVAMVVVKRITRFAYILHSIITCFSTVKNR